MSKWLALVSVLLVGSSAPICFASGTASFSTTIEVTEGWLEILEGGPFHIILSSNSEQSPTYEAIAYRASPFPGRPPLETRIKLPRDPQQLFIFVREQLETYRAISEMALIVAREYEAARTSDQKSAESDIQALIQKVAYFSNQASLVSGVSGVSGLSLS